MLWWIVENLLLVWLLLVPIALGFAFFWWTTRNNKLLTGVAVPAALVLLATLLSLVIVTDRQQLVRNVESMRDLINASKFDEALLHFEDEVIVDTAQMRGLRVKKENLKDLTKGNMSAYRVNKVVFNLIRVQEVARPDATVTFLVGPEDSAERGRCRMGFVLSPAGKWRVKTVTVESLGSNQPMPLLLPFGK